MRFVIHELKYRDGEKALLGHFCSFRSGSRLVFATLVGATGNDSNNFRKLVGSLEKPVALT